MTMEWSVGEREPPCEPHCCAPRHHLPMAMQEKLQELSQGRRVLKFSQSFVYFVFFAVSVLRGCSALDALDSGGSLTIGPSQVLLPWLPPSPPTPFPSVRAEVRVEGESSADGACLFWSQQSTSVVSLLRPDCPVTSPAEACALNASERSGSSRKRQCFSRVLVEAAPQQTPMRQRSWIFAALSGGANSSAEASGGHRPPSSTFRLQALVAPIARLELYTRDKRLAIGQIADVGVLAFDSEGNAFTTLEGVPFVWSVETSGVASEDAVVDLENVQADAAAATPTRRRVEEVGLSVSRMGGELPLRADSLVVRGRTPGVATLTARLASPVYSDVAPAQVQLTVADVLALIPGDLRVPPAALVSYKLIRLLDGGGSERVHLPSAPFSFAVRDVSVVSHASGESVFAAGNDAEIALSTKSLLAAVTQRGEVYVQGTREDGSVLCGEVRVDVWDTRISDRQSTRLFVSVPESLRLGFQSVSALSSKSSSWRRAVETARAAAKGSEEASRDMTLRIFASQEESQQLFGATFADSARDLLFSFAKGGSNSGLSHAAVLVEGEDYVFSLEALARVGSVVFLPENALIHWECRPERVDESEEVASVGADKGAVDSNEREGEAVASNACGLVKAAFAPRALAWFSAVSEGKGRVVATLLHVGDAVREESAEDIDFYEGFWRPSPALEASLSFRIQKRVGIRYFGVGPEVKTAQGMRLLVRPVLIPVGGTLELRPFGGSSRFVLTSRDPEVVSVESVGESASLDQRIGASFQKEEEEDAAVFVVKAGRAPGVALLTLRDSEQPSNLLQLFLIVAEPREVTLYSDALLLPLRSPLDGGQFEKNSLIVTAVATARLTSSLTERLPEAVRASLARSRVDEGRRTETVANDEEEVTLHRQALQFASCSGLDFDFEEGLEIAEEMTSPPFACRRVKLMGRREGRSEVNAFFPNFPNVTASLRVDVFAPLEALVVVEGFLLPLPEARRREVVAARLATAGFSERRHAIDSEKDGGNKGTSSFSSASASQEERVDFDVSDFSTLLRSVRLKDEALRLAAPASALSLAAECVRSSSEKMTSSSTCATTKASLPLAVGTQTSVVLRGGPPDRREAYRHFLHWRVQETERNSEREGGDADAAVIVVDASSTTPKREVSLICVSETKAPVRVIVESVHRPLEDSRLTASFEEKTEFQVECQMPQHLELFALPSLSQPWSARPSSFSEGVRLSPESPVDVRRERTLRLLEETEQTGRSSEETATVAAECGALHAFGVVAFDAQLRPLLNASSLSLSWSADFDGDKARFPPSNISDLSSKLRVEKATLYRDAPSQLSDVAFVAIAPTLCCGRAEVEVRLKISAATIASVGTALSPLQRKTFERTVAEWQTKVKEGRFPFWSKETQDLRASVVIITSPPLRIFPSLLSPKKTRAEGFSTSDFQRLRLFSNPEVAYRVLLEFGSGQHLKVRLFAKGEKGGSGSLLLLENPTSETASLLGGDESLSLARSLLSFDISPQQRLEVAMRKRWIEGSHHELRAVDLAFAHGDALFGVLSPSSSSSSSSSYSLKFPFEPLSVECRLALREVWIPGAPPSTSSHQNGGFRFEAVDVGLLEASPRKSDSWKVGRDSGSDQVTARLDAEVEFLSLKSLQLTLSEEPLALSAASGLPQDATSACRSVHWPSFSSSSSSAAGVGMGYALSVQAGGVYAVRVEALAEDGLLFDSKFFPAMRLSLSAESTSGEPHSRVHVFVGRKRLAGDEIAKRTRDRSAEARGEDRYDTSAFHRPLPNWFEKSALLQRAEDAVSVSLFVSTDTREGEDVPSASSCGDFFFVAFSEGVVRLTVEAVNPSRADQPRVSASLVVQVHAPLELLPSRFILLPGGHSLELASRGGRPGLLKLSGEEDADKDDDGSGGRGTEAYQSVQFRSSRPTVAAFVDAESDRKQTTALPSSLLVTGQEGESELRVVWRDAHGKPVAQAEAFVRVALPCNVQIRNSSDASRFFTSHRAFQRRVLPDGSFETKEETQAESETAVSRHQLYVHSSIPFRAALFDEKNDEFFAPSLFLPLGVVTSEETAHSEAVERLGVSVADLPKSAVVCRFVWAVSAEREVPAFLVESHEAEEAEATFATASRASRSRLHKGASRVLEGEGLAEVTLVGVTPGSLSLSVEVSCFRDARLVAGPLRAEKSVVVLPEALEEFNGELSSPLLLAAFGEYPMNKTLLRLLSLSSTASLSASSSSSIRRSSGGEEEEESAFFDGVFVPKSSSLSLLPEGRGAVAGSAKGGDVVVALRHAFESQSSMLDSDASRVAWLEVADVGALLLPGLPSLLALEETAEASIVLKSVKGAKVAMPSNFSFDAFTSHPSVLLGRVVYSTEGSVPRVFLKGLRRGCAVLSVVLTRISDGEASPSLLSPFAARRVCVDSDISPPSSKIPRLLPSSSAVAFLHGARARLVEFSSRGRKSKARLRLRLHFKAAALLTGLVATHAGLDRGPASLKQAMEMTQSWSLQTNFSGSRSTRCLSRETASQLLKFFSPKVEAALREAVHQAFGFPSPETLEALEEEMIGGEFESFSAPSVWISETQLSPSVQRDDSILFPRDSRCVEGRMASGGSALAFVDVELKGLAGVLASVIFKHSSVSGWNSNAKTLAKRIDGVELLMQKFWEVISATFPQALREATFATEGSRDAGGVSSKSCAEDRRVQIGFFPFLMAFVDWGSGLEASLAVSTAKSSGKGGGGCYSSGSSQGRGLLTSSSPERLSLSGGCRDSQLAVVGTEAGEAFVGFRKGRGSAVAEVKTLSSKEGSGEVSEKKHLLRVVAAASCFSSVFRVEAKTNAGSEVGGEGPSLMLNWSSLKSTRVGDCSLGVSSTGSGSSRLASASVLLLRVQVDEGRAGEVKWRDLHSTPFVSSSVVTDCAIANPILNLLFEARSQQLPLRLDEEGQSLVAHICLLLKRPSLSAEFDLGRIRQTLKAVKQGAKKPGDESFPLFKVPLGKPPSGFSADALQNAECQDALRSASKLDFSAPVSVFLSASLRPGTQVPQLSSVADAPWLLGCTHWRVQVSTQLLFDGRIMTSPGVVKAPKSGFLKFVLIKPLEDARRVLAVGDVFAEVFLFPVSEESPLVASVSSDAYEASVHQEGMLASITLRAATSAIPSVLKSQVLSASEETRLSFEAPWKAPASVSVRVHGAGMQQLVSFSVDAIGHGDSGAFFNGSRGGASGDIFVGEEEDEGLLALRVLFVGCLVVCAVCFVWYISATRGRKLSPSAEEKKTVRASSSASEKVGGKTEGSSEDALSSCLRRVCATRPWNSTGRDSASSQGPPFAASCRLKDDGHWVWEKALDGKGSSISNPNAQGLDALKGKSCFSTSAQLPEDKFELRRRPPASRFYQS